MGDVKSPWPPFGKGGEAVGNLWVKGPTMTTKMIFVLANSAKNQNFCVAGREIVRQADGHDYWGEWLRPVSDHDEGALSYSDCCLQNYWQVRPLDVVQVPCLQCENCPIQPENWRIQAGKPWIRLASWELEKASELIESPPALWLEPGLDTDRVTSEHIKLLKNHQSIYLIKPENFFIRIEYNPYQNMNKARGCFEYNRVCYELSITDPLFRKRYSLYNRELGDMKIDSPDDCFLCISLTPEFRGYHYKVIATVFELLILQPFSDNVEIPF